MKRTPLRRISKKRKPEYQAYLKERDEFLKDKFCQCPDYGFNGVPRKCYNRATQVHHMKRRSGTLLRDQRFWLPVCANHHQFIEDHKGLARQHKLILYK